ncbi:MAG: rRNA maturation RNase YbeY [Alphaproteobacteria bacterium]|nr:rRNA maturation RNase YbeY [Alphaproteobacteria bacterium]
MLTGDWTPEDETVAISAARAALAAMNPTRDLELSLALADDATVQKLNRDYRGQDKPTNVLSFESGDDADIPGEPLMLGDVVLARETCAREAGEEGKEFAHHLSHLTIHGVLHLMGFDHEDDAEAEEMESLEIKILADIGIANPYLEGAETK